MSLPIFRLAERRSDHILSLTAALQKPEVDVTDTTSVLYTVDGLHTPKQTWGVKMLHTWSKQVIITETIMCFCLHTHYAGAELLVCDVQRVSVSVKPPACPVLTCPLPAFKMRHLPGLRQTALNHFYLCLRRIISFYNKCFVFTSVLWVA